MRFAALGLLTLFAACSSAGAGAAPTPGGPTRVISTGDGAYVQLAQDTRGTSVQVAASPEQVWAALPAVYKELGVEPGTVDPASWTFGNARFVASRRFAGEPMANLLRCGSTATGAPISSTYRIRMSLLTHLQPAPEGKTEVSTLVQATASSNEGVSNDPVVCASTGALEERIATELRARVGG